MTLNADFGQILSGGSGKVFILDVTPTGSGNISGKTYVSNTVPPNTVLAECTSDTSDVTVHFMAEGGVNYSPTVSIGAIDCTNMQQYADDRRLFYGSIDITIAGSETVRVDSNTGEYDEADIVYDAPPVITSVTFVNGYPGSQTEVKSGDNYDIRVQVDKSVTRIEIDNDQASSGTTHTFAAATIKTVTTTIANRGTTAVLRPARVRVRTASGSYSGWVWTNVTGTPGSGVDGTTVVLCNNLYPTVSVGSVTYPLGQGALKSSENALVANTCTNFDTAAYTSPNGDLSIVNEDIYQSVKQVTRISGSYNVSVDNFRVVANRAANDSTAEDSGIVRIANVAAQLSIAEPYARLRSAGTGYSNVALTTPATTAEHTITINSNQIMSAVPTLADPPAGYGVWKSALFVDAGGMVAFTNDLKVDDSDTKGTQSWGAISGTNLSGLVTSAITGDGQYVLGGLEPRYYRIITGQNSTNENAEVSDYTKCTLDWRYTDGSGQVKALTRAPVINTSPPVSNQWTIDAEDINPTDFIIIDTAATQAQTQDTAILVEETV